MQNTEGPCVLLASEIGLDEDLIRLRTDLLDAALEAGLSSWRFLPLEDLLPRPGNTHTLRSDLARKALIFLYSEIWTSEQDLKLSALVDRADLDLSGILVINKRSSDTRLHGYIPHSNLITFTFQWEDETSPPVRDILDALKLRFERAVAHERKGDKAPLAAGAAAPRLDSTEAAKVSRRPSTIKPTSWERPHKEESPLGNRRDDDDDHDTSGSSISASKPSDRRDDTAGLYPVWFGTNRKPSHDGSSFLAERNDCITRGRVEVFIPKAHRFGETKTPWWRRLLRCDLRDDQLRVRKVCPLGRSDFYASIKAKMAEARKHGEADALVFLHGYSVSFEDAAIRAAQIGKDLSVNGATAFFSWPSWGARESYAADEASIEASEVHITEFLTEFAANCGADKIHMVAHSMGNRGLLRALHRVAAAAEGAVKLKFEQIFLAAPDVDRDLFIDLAKIFGRFGRRTTLYASSRDLALYMSEKLFKAPRAGYCPPHTVIVGIDTIEVPDFNVDLLGHSYFANADALLHDMFDLMRHDSPPDRRQRIEPATDGTQNFWQIRR
jgi:esterase/lipase superfamily enzyme